MLAVSHVTNLVNTLAGRTGQRRSLYDNCITLVIYTTKLGVKVVESEKSSFRLVTELCCGGGGLR